MIENKKTIPTNQDLIMPTLQAIMELGGSASIDEIDLKVFEIAKISDEVISIPHKKGSNQSAVRYNIAWSRTFLKKFGLIENTARRIWSLTDGNINLSDYNNTYIAKVAIEKMRQEKEARPKDNHKSSNYDIDNIVNSELDESVEWKDELIEKLCNISPSAFERLTQRILKVSGFTQVEVTGQPGDEGVDGKGIISIGGLISFHVFFQCKRYKGSVSSSQIRDFRGAMQGRADKGILITTGTFTRGAIKEATRDGAPPIDLIDGEALCYKLKELSLGVKTQMIESITIDSEWFNKL